MTKEKPQRRRGQKEKEITSYVQNIIPISDVRDGIIITTDKRYIKIIEIEPINFNLRSLEEQEQIIYSFYSFLKVSNIKMQFKAMTFKANSQRHIENILEDLKTETNEKTKELAHNYIDFVNSYGRKKALTRRFFLILEYESASNATRTNDFINIYKTLENACQMAKTYIGQCGNNVIIPNDGDSFTMELLYTFYNRQSSLTETLSERVERVVKDTMKSRNRTIGVDEIPSISKVNFIAPRGIEFKSNYTVMDGLYYSFIYITSKGYKSKVYAGWLSRFVNMGEGIDVDIFFEKKSKSSVLSKLSRNMRINKINLKDKNSDASDFEEIGSAYTSSMYIKNRMQLNQEDLYDTSIIITIHDKTLENMINKKRAVINYIRSEDFNTRDCLFQQKEALQSVTPILNIDKDISKKSRRNFLTSTASSAYMFTSFQMCDDTGVLLGINTYNNTLCIVDIFNTKLYKNANMVIIGTSGSGKTFTLQLMALRMRMKGIQCFIIAPLKGIEFKRACHQIGGQFIKISPGSKDCINIMGIRPREKSSESILDEDGLEYDHEESLLANKIQQINIFFHLLIPDLTEQEEQLLDETLIRTYAHYGIINDSESIYEEDGTLKQMPILGDLYQFMKNEIELERVANILRKYVVGSAESFNQRTNVDLDNKYIVFDISELKGRDKPIGMFICLDYAWDKIREDRTKKKAIYIDETWELIGSGSNKYSAEFVLQIFKIIRGYGGSAIAATQDINDFFALENGKYGSGIINNAKTKIVLNLEDEELKKVKTILNLSKTECNRIRNANKGEAIIMSNSNKIPVAVKASELEENLISTDRSKIQEQVMKKEKELLEENNLRYIFSGNK